MPPERLTALWTGKHRRPYGVGNLDLSGIWQTDLKYNASLAVDLKAGDYVVMLPWGQTLYDVRQGNNGKDDPEGSVFSRECRA